MTGIAEDSATSWDSMHKAWEELRKHAPDNVWLAHYDGNSFKQHDLADLLWTRKEFEETKHGVLHLLFKYQQKLEEELSQFQKAT